MYNLGSTLSAGHLTRVCKSMSDVLCFDLVCWAHQHTDTFLLTFVILGLGYTM